MHKLLFYDKFIIFLYMKHVEEYNKLIIKQEFVY